MIFAVLLSAGVSFASDENSTDIISNSVDGSVIATTNADDVVETSDDSTLSVDYSDAVNDNTSTIKTGKVT